MAAIIIDIQRAVKSFSGYIAVNSFSLQVRQGEIIGLLGPNGAGKSTLINLILGFQKPDSGVVRVFDHDPLRLPLSLKEKMGVQFESNIFHGNAKVYEIFDLYASFYKKPLAVSHILQILKLESKRDAFFQSLSKGMKHKIGLGLALIGDPELIILDEPTSGLDLAMRRDLEETLESIRAKGKTILLTTHYLDEAERLCDTVVFMENGRIAGQGAPRQLIKTVGFSHKIEIHRSLLNISDEEIRVAFTGSYRVNIGKTKVSVLADDPIPVIREINRICGTDCDLRLTRTSLEDYYFEISGREYHHE